MPNMNKIWLSSPHMGGGEQKYIKKAFQGNWISTIGPNLNGFEKDLEIYLGEQKKVAALSSGTAAIHLALLLSGVTKGDDVICQSFTFSASANPIVYQGATPVFVDSEQDTWNMCPIQLEKTIKDRVAKGKKPKAIIVVHLYGMPAKIEEIVTIAKKYEVKLIEDAAEALGSTYKGRQCGTFGDYGVLSFNGNKIITTSGGGALICGSQEDKDRAVFLASQAKEKAVHYQHKVIGYNYGLSNIGAGIGRGQMEVLDKHIQLRKDNNTFYRELFDNVNGVSVFREPNAVFSSNHWLSCILISEEITGFSKEKLRLSLLADNIESRPLWKPMHLQPVFKSLEFYNNGFSGRLFTSGLCLPSGSNLNGSEKQRIKESLRKVLH